MPSTLSTRVWDEGVELELSNFVHAWTKVWSRASSRIYLDRLKIVDSRALKKLSILNFFSYAKHFVHASLGWRSWARAFKFYTRFNQGLKSCLVKVSSRSVENWRFWNALKIVDFKLFFICQALCAGEFGMKQLSYTFQILFSYKLRSEVVPR